MRHDAPLRRRLLLLLPRQLCLEPLAEVVRNVVVVPILHRRQVWVQSGELRLAGTSCKRPAGYRTRPLPQARQQRACEHLACDHPPIRVSLHHPPAPTAPGSWGPPGARPSLGGARGGRAQGASGSWQASGRPMVAVGRRARSLRAAGHRLPLASWIGDRLGRPFTEQCAARAQEAAAAAFRRRLPRPPQAGAHGLQVAPGSAHPRSQTPQTRPPPPSAAPGA